MKAIDMYGNILPDSWSDRPNPCAECRYLEGDRNREENYRSYACGHPDQENDIYTNRMAYKLNGEMFYHDHDNGRCMFIEYE